MRSKFQMVHPMDIDTLCTPIVLYLKNIDLEERERERGKEGKREGGRKGKRDGEGLSCTSIIKNKNSI